MLVVPNLSVTKPLLLGEIFSKVLYIHYWGQIAKKAQFLFRHLNAAWPDLLMNSAIHQHFSENKWGFWVLSNFENLATTYRWLNGSCTLLEISLLVDIQALLLKIFRINLKTHIVR